MFGSHAANTVNMMSGETSGVLGDGARHVNVGTALQMMQRVTLSGKRVNFAVTDCPIVVDPEPAKKLTESVQPVSMAMMKLARTLPVVGFVATGAVVVAEMVGHKHEHTPVQQIKSAFVGTAQVVSKGAAGVDMDTFIETFAEVREKLHDKKFAAATAAAIAGLVEIGTEAIAGPIAGHGAREIVRKLSKRLGGDAIVPNRSDSLAVCKETMFLKDTLAKPADNRHEQFTCTKVPTLSGKPMYRVDFKP